MLPITTQADAYFLPDDAQAAVTAIIGAIGAAKQTLRIIAYGFTHPGILQAVQDAYKRGVDVKIILDLTQSQGKVEAVMLHQMMQAVPPANFHIGTSTRHQIIHDKCGVVDGLTPDAVVLEGSLNWTTSGPSEMNTLMVMPCPALAAEFHRRFDVQWSWLATNEAKDQPAA